MTTVEVMNESRRRKRIGKAASQLAAAAAEAAAPSKRVKLTQGAGGILAVDEDDDGGMSDDANADIIMRMTKEEKGARHNAASKASKKHVQDCSEKKMSSSKMKALNRLKDRQDRESKRSEILESLVKHSVDATETTLLRSSSKMGKGKQTKKERLQQALREQRVGISVTDATGLVVGMNNEGMSARKKRKMEMERREMEAKSSSGGEEDEDEEEEEEEEQVAPTVPNVHAKAEAIPETKGGKMPDPKVEEEGAMEEEEEEEEEQEKQAVVVPSSKGGKGGARATSGDVGGDARKAAFYVKVKRLRSIQAIREKLPVFAEEQQIMEAIK